MANGARDTRPGVSASAGPSKDWKGVKGSSVCVTRLALFRPQPGSLGPRAVRWGWRGPRLLRLDRGHGIKEGRGRLDVTNKVKL